MESDGVESNICIYCATGWLNIGAAGAALSGKNCFSSGKPCAVHNFNIRESWYCKLGKYQPNASVNPAKLDFCGARVRMNALVTLCPRHTCHTILRG